MKTIKVNDKVYAKTMLFGNQKSLTIFKNKNKYDRKLNKQYIRDASEIQK